MEPVTAPDIPIGKRVKFYREGRGLSQADLGSRVSLAEDYISQIERGARTPPIATLQRIARVLGTSISALLGHPTVEGVVGDPAAAHIYRALTDVANRRQTANGPPDLLKLREDVDQAWTIWQGGEGTYTRTGRLLPDLILLIERARHSYHTPAETDLRREAARIAADGYFLVRMFCSYIGRGDLALLAADRANRAAEDSDDLLRLGRAAWDVSYGLMRDCEFEGAEQIALQAIAELEPQATDDHPELLAMYGQLQLHSALVAVRQSDPWTARQLIRDKALPAARAVGDGNVMWTAFGPTNCAIHLVAIEMEAGHAIEGIRLADQVDVALTPVTERRCRHYMEVAKCYDLKHDDMGTLTHLRLAWDSAPEHLQHNPLVRDMVHGLLHRARPSYAPEVRNLANRIGLTA
ncbi:MAG: helix-turn-helix transcriptional regulator [Candidatus Dormibacteraeota bacterium]|nr:helix-turn-helix transcriptional regulator [Candidatus Dormibacteraeota bacterium]